MNSQRKNEIIGFLFMAVGLLVFVSLVSYNADDLSFFISTPNANITNFVGVIGAYLSTSLIFLIGRAAYAVPILCLIWAMNKFSGHESQRLYVKISGTFVLFFAVSAFFALLFNETSADKMNAGGAFGFIIASGLERYCGFVGAFIVLATLIILSILLATEFLIIPFAASFLSKLNDYFINRRQDVMIDKQEKKTRGRGRPSKDKSVIEELKKVGGNLAEAAKRVVQNVSSKTSESLNLNQVSRKPEIKIKTTKREKFLSKNVDSEKPPVDKEDSAMAAKTSDSYKLPTLDLLEFPPNVEENQLKEDLTVSSAILEDTLREFGIDVKVTEVEKGPVITRYELEPSPGVKINKITALCDDIALAMKAPTVRIIAPIPGKARVGIEVPNTTSSLVYLREILDTNEFRNSKSKLTLALGKDTAGVPVMCELGKMPHLLIAGTTGSGKTVCVNAIILSMLYNARPDELKFIMIDPKMVEMMGYNRIPHLISPVVTDVKKASGALAWVVGEMESRYKVFAKLGARNITVYNQRFNEGKYKDDPDCPGKMPYIVVVIDELADLMATAAQEIEYAIGRLAQLSRAVGIHMILATQRPSVDVITGVIKANFPARISFKVASKVDSRTVLDMNGADKLLGRGDMLFMEPAAAKPVRAQCSLVSDKEIERVVDFISAQQTPEFEDAVLKVQDKKTLGKSDDKDDLYDEAVKLVLSSGQASVSIIQRRMRLSYTRAARIIDSMEEEGLVGPFCGSKAREILVDAEAYFNARQEEEQKV
ncbi:MAG: DNA translocase FtsK [Candidatus Omnitrophota bacterium]